MYSNLRNRSKITIYMKTLANKVPEGSLAKKWTKYRGEMPLVAPNNKRNLEVIVVGTGLAGASAAASLGELGYQVKAFCFHDSPRRAHSIAAQGGINAAKNYQNDGDSIYRLFYDTIKGGDYRSREANVHRLAEVSLDIIDQCVAQGVPFAREYGGNLASVHSDDENDFVFSRGYEVTGGRGSVWLGLRVSIKLIENFFYHSRTFQREFFYDNFCLTDFSLLK